MTAGAVAALVFCLAAATVCCLAAARAVEALRQSLRIERNLQRRAREEWALREVIRAAATKYNGNN